MSASDREKIIYFGETDFRNQKRKFGIKNDDRTRHVYVIGKTGMGKSTLLENMAIQDIQLGHGMGFIDPHGKTAELMLDYIPAERVKDVIYFDPDDLDRPLSFNVMEDVEPERRHLVVSGLMSSFKKIWPDVWSARMEYILTNILLALIEYPGATLLGVNRMLADKDFRKRVVENISDVSVRAFWVDEFAKYTDRYMQEAGAAIQNKIGQFVSNPVVRNIIGQPKSSFDIREIMDDGKILIMNLSKGKIGETNAQLLGSMLITKIYLAAMSRARVSAAELRALPEYYLFVDEFQSFVSDSFADILSEARKYKLSLTIAHQYIEQMPETVRNAVFGNVGTTISFRVGPFDAEVLEKIFMPQFTAEDLIGLGFAQVYMTLMIDGVGSPPFSATTMAPIAPDEISHKAAVIRQSRTRFGQPRQGVEEEIRKWHEPIQPATVRPAKEKNENADKRELRSTPVQISTARVERPGRDPLQNDDVASASRRTASQVPLRTKSKQHSASAQFSRTGAPPLAGHSSLKAAIASAIGKPVVVSPRVSKDIPQSAPRPSESASEKTTGEVPEEVLRKVLHGNDGRPGGN
ncbi:MAG: type IV secretion system DNA-binding domain-containing protein [Candidatus Vogelbacteria bacterium]|nr:type IV secretion system DNA-binding domain-containing protein [Candidatus Vogelbacteria bacterium]